MKGLIIVEVILLSRNKYKQLTKLNLPKLVLNTESEIFNYRYKGKDKVFKRWYNDDGQNIAKKLYTLEMLDYYKKNFPYNFCIPDHLVCVAGKVQGFTMPKVEGTNLNVILTDERTAKQEQILYLKKIGELLNQMEHVKKYSELKSFNVGDLHASNFIANTNNKTIYVVDLDSSKIGSSSPYPAMYLSPIGLSKHVPQKYKRDNLTGYVMADDNSDKYCYILMILNYLYGSNVNNFSLEEFFNYLAYLKKIGVNNNLLNQFLDIVNNKDNQNPYQYLETLTDTQIVRARRYVYDKVRK